MKKNLLAIIGTVILLTSFFSPSVYALGFGVQAEYWFPAFEGDLRVDNNGVTGTEINVKDDLGVSNENFPGVKAFFEIGNHEFTVAYSQVDLSGAKKIDKEIRFDGDTYIADSYVESDLKTSMIDFEYQYKFLNLENILAGFSL